jgi:hypothetical protein
MKCESTAISVALVSLLSQPAIFARAYYVAPKDTVNEDGTIEHPYPRIQQSGVLMAAGDTATSVREPTAKQCARIIQDRREARFSSGRTEMKDRSLTTQI